MGKTTTETKAQKTAILDLGFLLKMQPQAYQYNICNGFTNQLLYHAGHIARAAAQRRPVEIPNHFIINGAQESDANVLPMANNSVPLNAVFDEATLLQAVARLNITAKLVNLFPETASNFKNKKDLMLSSSSETIPCLGMASLQGTNPDVVLFLLKEAFRPTPVLQTLIDAVRSKLPSNDKNAAICLHHRNGRDWQDHCKRWSKLQKYDGVFRGNCLGVPGRTFLQSLEDRGLTRHHTLYYCGDENDIPETLANHSKYTVVTRNQLVSNETQIQLLQETLFKSDARMDLDSQGVSSNNNVVVNMRDIFALLDFFVCRDITHFIGNSVSTFSAVQIALRQGDHAYWYNSRNIPLSTHWRAYQIPIVYTYTERSQSSGKHLLQVSITSLLMHMPHAQVHVLYNGDQDKPLRQWLVARGVILHTHEPTWGNIIERVRINGNKNMSHLFAHAGNYFGTWQRIDIPLHIHSEYCLLLDSDTLIMRPFTMADLGSKLPSGVAMSSEMNIKDRVPSNAGVMLMNVPHLRQTYYRFLYFITKLSSGVKKLDHPSPSDQGAYLVFYKDKTSFLSPRFNFKPYWKEGDSGVRGPYIVHFHGAKPHDYLKYLFGQECDPAIQILCREAPDCRSLQAFARASKTVDSTAYCKSAFNTKASVNFCNLVLDALAESEEECHDLSAFVWQKMHTMSKENYSPFGFTSELLAPNDIGRTGLRSLMIGSIITWVVLAVATVRWRGKRPEVMGALVLTWALVTFLIHAGVVVSITN